MQALSSLLTRQYPFFVVPASDDGFFISFPDLPGCMTQVDQAAEIGPAAEEIRVLWLETAHEQGIDILLPFNRDMLIDTGRLAPSVVGEPTS